MKHNRIATVDLEIRLLDCLFNKGHAVNKPLIKDIVEFVYAYGLGSYQQAQHLHAFGDDNRCTHCQLTVKELAANTSGHD